MSDELIALLSLGISLPVSIGYYKKVMGGNSKQDKFVEKAKRSGCVATGVSVDTEYLPGDINGKNLAERSPMVRVKYEYRVDGVAYHKYMNFQKPGHSLIDYPEQVTVYYDRNNPRKTISPEEFSAANRKQSGCLGAVGIWFVLMLILINGLRMLFQG